MSNTLRRDQNGRATDGKEAEPNFEELLAASFKPAPPISIGDRVEALIVAIDRENIFLEMGTRVEGFVNKLEFIEDGKLIVKEGQRIKVFVAGKSQGILHCKRHLGSAEKDTSDFENEAVYFALKDAYESSLSVEGRVKEMGKAGFEVTVMGQRTFCPISQIERSYCENPESHINKVYTFKIIEFKEDGKRIVLSRKEILLEEEDKKTDKLWQGIELGAVYEGTVTSVKKYGAFLNIGGVDGLLHVSEISYGRTEDAQDVIKAGQKLKVKVIDIDREKRKMSFSLKTQLENPWYQALKELKVGQEIMGKVVRLKPYGAFIEVLPGLDGLLHVSHLSRDKKHEHPKEVMKPGDVLKLWILEIDEKKKTIALTMEEPERDISNDLRQLQEEQDKQAKESAGSFAGLAEHPGENQDKKVAVDKEENKVEDKAGNEIEDKQENE